MIVYWIVEAESKGEWHPVNQPPFSTEARANVVAKFLATEPHARSTRVAPFARIMDKNRPKGGALGSIE